MPTRLVREGILTSERVNKLTFPAEVFYRRLMSVVDDFGRFYASPTLLRASCYPLAIDAVTDKQINDWLAECIEANLIIAYSVENKRFLELLDFRQQVRAKVSKFPSDPSKCKQMQTVATQPLTDATQVLAGATQPLTDVHLDGDEDGDEDEDDGGSGKILTRIKKGWKPSDEEIDYFNKKCGPLGLDLNQTAEGFSLYFRQTGKKNVDWTATWQNWCRNAVKFHQIEMEKKKAAKGLDPFAGAL